MAVLPFLEEQKLFDQFAFSKGVISDANVPAISRVLPVFQCPSTPGYPRSSFQSDSGVNPRAVRSGLESVTIGCWDYGVQATLEQRAAPAWFGVKNQSSFEFLFEQQTAQFSCPLAKAHGNGGRLAWVTDGLSKTSVAHEIAYLPIVFSRIGLDGKYTDSGEAMSGNVWIQTHGSGWAQSLSFKSALGRPINETNSSDGRFAFHSGGLNEAFLDGSVRFLSETTSLQVLRALVSRADGESFKTPWE